MNEQRIMNKEQKNCHFILESVHLINELAAHLLYFNKTRHF